MLLQTKTNSHASRSRIKRALQHNCRDKSESCSSSDDEKCHSNDKENSTYRTKMQELKNKSTLYQAALPFSAIDKCDYHSSSIIPSSLRPQYHFFGQPFHLAPLTLRSSSPTVPDFFTFQPPQSSKCTETLTDNETSQKDLYNSSDYEPPSFKVPTSDTSPTSNLQPQKGEKTTFNAPIDERSISLRKMNEQFKPLTQTPVVVITDSFTVPSLTAEKSIETIQQIANDDSSSPPPEITNPYLPSSFPIHVSSPSLNATPVPFSMAILSLFETITQLLIVTGGLDTMVDEVVSFSLYLLCQRDQWKSMRSHDGTATKDDNKKEEFGNEKENEIDDDTDFSIKHIDDNNTDSKPDSTNDSEDIHIKILCIRHFVLRYCYFRGMELIQKAARTLLKVHSFMLNKEKEKQLQAEKIKGKEVIIIGEDSDCAKEDEPSYYRNNKEEKNIEDKKDIKILHKDEILSENTSSSSSSDSLESQESFVSSSIISKVHKEKYTNHSSPKVRIFQRTTAFERRIRFLENSAFLHYLPNVLIEAPFPGIHFHSIRLTELKKKQEEKQIPRVPAQLPRPISPPPEANVFLEQKNSPLIPLTPLTPLNLIFISLNRANKRTNHLSNSELNAMPPSAVITPPLPHSPSLTSFQSPSHQPKEHNSPDGAEVSEAELKYPELFSTPTDVVMSERFNIPMTKQKIQCLVEGKWLNDEVINYVLELMKRRMIRAIEKWGGRLEKARMRLVLEKKVISEAIKIEKDEKDMKSASDSNKHYFKFSAYSTNKTELKINPEKILFSETIACTHHSQWNGELVRKTTTSLFRDSYLHKQAEKMDKEEVKQTFENKHKTLSHFENLIEWKDEEVANVLNSITKINIFKHFEYEKSWFVSSHPIPFLKQISNSTPTQTTPSISRQMDNNTSKSSQVFSLTATSPSSSSSISSIVTQQHVSNQLFPKSSDRILSNQASTYSPGKPIDLTEDKPPYISSTLYSHPFVSATTSLYATPHWRDTPIPLCFFFNTFFYQKLSKGGEGYSFDAVKRWTRKRSVFSMYERTLKWNDWIGKTRKRIRKINIQRNDDNSENETLSNTEEYKNEKPLNRKMDSQFSKKKECKEENWRTMCWTFDKVIIPVYLSSHWTLCVINLRLQQFEYFDSLKKNGEKVVGVIKRWVADEIADKGIKVWRKASSKRKRMISEDEKESHHLKSNEFEHKITEIESDSSSESEDSSNSSNDSDVIFEEVMGEEGKKEIIREVINWPLFCPSNMPRQQNSSDCGVFLLLSCDCVLRNAPLIFGQAAISKVRDELIKLLLNPDSEL
ncbi:putative Ulp1 protease family, C-terminal catalytic domain [Monocercomonoides exilis]|uniref:putative Ulp1 protease family, C-terminal catalytic domain n=1 Tax=Monocercomonoides exilis TaxID=2049356 RepID=UPI00355A6B7C|nr:putative Ulp1 protease family, C-terminal catalytic domain [Monocercomonoides exilis]|eukprot:MONOS_11594.1-p1 / transcript=MONOS_11594.1 / gene=MONOS_11594 / organism=Monocercomonoides_exilis_PA203 / gene_product=Ulp1 protease family, C-terminal catalytic domain / transcript_product=Ulp1 protease family, C-terminal catalytic domain / location=Mono_scaffold00590:3642-7535(+) / protein_length=1298 / sequence_SO=supercontig / SO=protein_coding / is_pseudo=false